MAKQTLSNLWMEFLLRFTKDGHDLGLCGLCGNKGLVDTTTSAFSPMGIPCGGIFWCICPNGRVMRKRSIGSKYGESSRIEVIHKMK